MQKNKIILTTFLIIILILFLNLSLSQELSNPSITITEINLTNNKLNITYEFNNQNFIGDEITLEVWITNESGTEINRLTDAFSINRDPPIKRNLLTQIPEDIIKQSKKSFQIIYINIAPSSDLNNPTRQSFIIQKPEKKPSSVNKTLIYLILFIILFITIFVLINISKIKLPLKKPKEKHRNKGLLPKPQKP